MPKTWAEIRRIAWERRPDSLDDLSEMDLHFLLAMLNRQRVPRWEEGDFSQFYLEVVARIRNLIPPTQKGRAAHE